MVVYLGALGNHFAQDDNQIIAFNALVHHVSGLWRAFAESYWPADVGGGPYRPLAIASYAIDWSLSGGATWRAPASASAAVDGCARRVAPRGTCSIYSLAWPPSTATATSRACSSA